MGEYLAQQGIFGTLEEQIAAIMADQDRKDEFLGAAGIGGEIVDNLSDLTDLQMRAQQAGHGEAGGAARLSVAISELYKEGSLTRQHLQNLEA